MLHSKSSDIETYTKDLFAKIFAFLHDINFRLSIYIIVTKCECYSRFYRFCTLIGSLIEATNFQKDGLLLRGVYFTGRPKEIKISDELLEPS